MVSVARRAGRGRRGFTLIELLVVLAIIALLLSIAMPRYFRSVQHARESTLRTSLNVMRDAIDKFAADQGRYPTTLVEMVDKHYLKNVPADPLTGSAQSWVVVAPSDDSLYSGDVADVKSGAQGQGSDGTDYQAW